MKSQYNTSERIIARNIHDLKTKQRNCFIRWHDIDLKVNILKHNLQGKYQERKVMVPNLLTKDI